jgi:hypothetical protein
MNTWTQCVIDASLSRDGLFCFCPIEGDIDKDFSVVTGMNFLGSKPDDMKLVAVIHPDGQEAAEKFCNQWREQLDALKAASIN